MLPELAWHTEKLVYFFEIAQMGSFHGAARKLGVSAPTLSYAIKKLEGIMTVRLFHRSRQGITLTSQGEQTLAFCQRYFRELEALQRQVLRTKAEAIVRVRVGTYQSIAIYFWPTLLSTLGRDTPSLSLSITTGRSQYLMEALVKREIDVALTVGKINHEGLIGHELYHDSYQFYCSRQWADPHLAADNIGAHPLLYIPDARDESGRTLQQHIYSWGLFFQEDFALDSFEVIGEFIKRGYGIGILPLKVAHTYGDTLQPLTIEGIPEGSFGRHGFYLSYREDLELPQRLIQSLLRAAKEAVRREGEGDKAQPPSST